jgi:hypothetical protein
VEVESASWTTPASVSSEPKPASGEKARTTVQVDVLHTRLPEVVAIERLGDSLHNGEGEIPEETSPADNLVQVAVEASTSPFFLDATMTSKVKPEVRRIGLKQFQRWVIIDGGSNVPTHLRFWNGERWVEGLRNAMLFAHKGLVLTELKKAKEE